MIIVRPNLYVPGTVIRSAEVNDDFDTLYNDYNGNIDNSNIANTAAIEVLKLEDMLTGEIIVGNTATTRPQIVTMHGNATVAADGTVTVSGGSGSTTSVIANDVATNATMFPVWVTANTGALPLYVSSTLFQWNPGLNGGTLTLPRLSVTTVDAGTIPVYSVHPAFTIDTQIIDKKYVDDNFVPTGTVANHVHSATAGEGGNSLTLGAGSLTTLDTTGLTIKNDDIYESATDADTGVLNFNYVGYADGTTHYRNIHVYDGKQNSVFAIRGDASSSVYLTSPARFYVLTDSATPSTGLTIAGANISSHGQITPRSVAKAWITFSYDGSTGVVVVLDSYNMDAPTYTDAGPGEFDKYFTITLTKDMDSTSYSVVTSSDGSSAAGWGQIIAPNVRDKAAGSFKLIPHAYNGGAITNGAVAGLSITDIVVFGKLAF
jgi:hypothetical protein